jgi:putative oxidoreductase
VTSVVLLRFAIASLLEGPPPQIVTLQIIAVVTGVLILVGLWTPMAGTLALMINLWIAFLRYSSHSGDPWMPVIAGALGASLAMIGPGSWSIDARLFGRKHIDLPDDV